MTTFQSLSIQVNLTERMLSRSIKSLNPSNLAKSINGTSKQINLIKRNYSSEVGLDEFVERGPSFGLSEDQLSFQQLARDFTVS